MMFGCSVKLKPNESKTHYEKVLIDDRSFYLDHYILEEDVTELNAIRASVAKALLETKGINRSEDIWPLLKNYGN